MTFGPVGGENLLWNGTLSQGQPPCAAGWKNWGGDKTWLAPQSQWKNLYGRDWPPEPAWDARPWITTFVSANRLTLCTTQLSAAGLRLFRDYCFENGEFVVRQTLRKEVGPRLSGALWDIAQVGGMDAVYLIRGNASPYRWISDRVDASAPEIKGKLVHLERSSPLCYKIGASPARPAVIAVKGKLALRLRADLSSGPPPEGEESVEVFNGYAYSETPYFELELLAPGVPLKIGSSQTLSVRWSVHILPETPDAARKAILSLLR